MQMITPERILPSLQAVSKKEALREISMAIAKGHQVLDGDGVFNALLEREALGSTGIGDGIAIPHAKMDCLLETIVFFARSKKGVHFDAHDSHPVHLFFVMLAPSGTATSYLANLAKLSRFLKSETVRSQLLQAGEPEELYAILAELQLD